jgi:uncharacterized cofD-like protein
VTVPDGPRVVALGGGHGLAASLAALRQVAGNLTAVVTVADDGGSSGRLRTELGALPPGDLRMALTALADQDEWTRLFQYRFGGSGPLAGHAVGNFILTALSDVLSGPVPALDLAGSVLHAAGRVLPMSEQPVDIVAEVVDELPDGTASSNADTREVRGQVAVATTTGRVVSVRLVPPQPRACPEAVAAIGSAEAVVLGPGSLFTSVLPHLLTPELRDAVCQAPGRVVLVLNLVAQQGETSGFSPEAHLDALAAQVPELRLDCVIADSAAISDRAALTAAVERLGGTLHLGPVAVPGEPRHDPELLAEAFRKVLGA